MAQALAYEVVGPEPVAGSEPLVLLHAFPLERSMWRPVATRLTALASVVLVDLPGLGRSGPGGTGRPGGSSALPEGEPSLDVSADGVLAVLDALGVERAVLGGVSMGGYVAMAVAERSPQRLAGLALVGTKAEADGDEARANRFRMADAVLGETGTRALLPMLDTLLGATSHARRAELVEHVRDALLAAPPSGVAWSQRAMAARPDRTAVLASLPVPAVVVGGEEDGLMPPSVARSLAATLPDCVLTLLPEAGHLSPLERPDAVAHTLAGLLVRTR